MNAGFSLEEDQKFTKYFGQHPDVMEGSIYFSGSENEPFIMALWGTEKDLSGN